MQLTTKDTSVTVELSAACFDKPFNEVLVHQAVVAHMAGGRAGTRSQKTRAEVSGGGLKPFRQKGTGRARAGSIRSPLWRGGGKVFAASTRDFSQKINRKMYRSALRSILSELFRQQRIHLLEHFVVSSGRTRDAVQSLGDLLGERLLIIVDDMDENTQRAVRNLPYVHMISAAQINPTSLVAADRVLLTASAVQKIEGWLV